MAKDIYGLSEGVFKACQFLGLKFPSKAVNNPQPVPSDYFGDDFELDSAMIKKLCAERKWTNEKFDKAYKSFAKKYNSQKCFPKHTKTDLSVYFCDFALSSRKQGANADDYFDFEFYNKSHEFQNSFITMAYRHKITRIYDDFYAIELGEDKSQTNKFFARFLHRDWIYTQECTFEEFEAFVEKHPRFFSKPVSNLQGRGAAVISVGSPESLKELFESLKSRNRLLEEIVKQHETLSAFCPDTLNTIRVYTILDIHNVVHILAMSGRFGRIGGVVDNFSKEGFGVVIDPKTGIIISDAINKNHERTQKHPDTGKIFKGFQYPCWEKLRATIKKMAKMIPQLRYIGWDITINDNGEIVLIEINQSPGIAIPQSATNSGKLYLYEPLRNEMVNYKATQMRILGWRVNNLSDFASAYDTPSRKDTRLKFAMSKLIPDCESLMDLGCRKTKFVQSITPPI